MTLAKSFEVAIIDGINIYVRTVLLKGGYIPQEGFDASHTQETLEEKYKIARRLADAWAKKIIDEDIRD